MTNKMTDKIFFFNFFILNAMRSFFTSNSTFMLIAITIAMFSTLTLGYINSFSIIAYSLASFYLISIIVLKTKVKKNINTFFDDFIKRNEDSIKKLKCKKLKKLKNKYPLFFDKYHINEDEKPKSDQRSITLVLKNSTDVLQYPEKIEVFLFSSSVKILINNEVWVENDCFFTNFYRYKNIKDIFLEKNLANKKPSKSLFNMRNYDIGSVKSFAFHNPFSPGSRRDSEILLEKKVDLKLRKRLIIKLISYVSLSTLAMILFLSITAIVLSITINEMFILDLKFYLTLISCFLLIIAHDFCLGITATYFKNSYDNIDLEPVANYLENTIKGLQINTETFTCQGEEFINTEKENLDGVYLKSFRFVDKKLFIRINYMGLTLNNDSLDELKKMGLKKNDLLDPDFLDLYELKNAS